MPGMPNQIYEWVGPRQHCSQCHYGNFLGTPITTYNLLEKSGAAIVGECLPASVSC